MDWMLVSIVVLLILSIIWFIVKYKKDLRRDEKIFEKYLQDRKRITLPEKNEE